MSKGETVNGELWYPRSEDRPDSLTVSLWDVRAAGDLTISFDFERNGWVISMDRMIEVGDTLEVAGQVEEVAFIDAWNVKKIDTEMHAPPGVTLGGFWNHDGSPNSEYPPIELGE